jgi:hypothetical protein
MAKKTVNPLQTVYREINDNAKVIKMHLADIVSYDLKLPQGHINAKNQALYIKGKIENIIKLIGESQKLK